MGSDRLRLSSQLAKLGAWLTGRGKEDVDERKQRRVIMQSRGYVLTLSAQACLPFCFSDPFPDVNAHSLPHIAVCVCLFLVSNFLPHISHALWQLCWWWLCAHGASWLWGPRWRTWQLLMFRCSTPLTQRPWSHTHTITHTNIYKHIKLAQEYTQKTEAVMYLHNYGHKMHILLLLLRKSKQH